IIDAAKESMEDSIAHLNKSLLNIRAGKANPQMLGSVFVDYYGSATALSQVANINVPDPRTLTVTPWEKNMLQPIEKAIMIANLGLNPMNNGDTIIINIPALTEERRKDLAKQAKGEAGVATTSIGDARKDATPDTKKQDKEGTSEGGCSGAEDRVEKLTDAYSQEVGAAGAETEAGFMKLQVRSPRFEWVCM